LIKKKKIINKNTNTKILQKNKEKEKINSCIAKKNNQ